MSTTVKTMRGVSLVMAVTEIKCWKYLLYTKRDMHARGVWARWIELKQVVKNKKGKVPTLQLYLLIPFHPGKTSGVMLSSSRLKSSRAWTTSSWYWDTILASDWAASTWTNTRDMWLKWTKSTIHTPKNTSSIHLLIDILLGTYKQHKERNLLLRRRNISLIFVSF